MKAKRYNIRDFLPIIGTVRGLGKDALEYYTAGTTATRSTVRVHTHAMAHPGKVLKILKLCNCVSLPRF